MLEYMRKIHKKISSLLLIFFIVSSFGLVVQTNAHAIMFVEMQQHKAMGHDMTGHCQPVICESVNAQDSQNNSGSEPYTLIDLAQIPASFVITLVDVNTFSTDNSAFYLNAENDPPPLQKTGLLLI